MAVGTGTPTVTGGEGADTIRILSGTTAGNFQLLAGAGNDSIFVGGVSAGRGSINGGDGADTINLLVATAAGTTAAATARITINGGAGADIIDFSAATAISGVTLATGSITTALCALLGSVVYGAGDKIRLSNSGVIVSGANWRGTGAAASINVASSITGILSGITSNGAGSISVFDLGDDLIVGIGGSINGSHAALIHIVNGDDLLKTTVVGNLAVTSTNFGFTVNRTNTTGTGGGISIDFA